MEATGLKMLCLLFVPTHIENAFYDGGFNVIIFINPISNIGSISCFNLSICLEARHLKIIEYDFGKIR